MIYLHLKKILVKYWLVIWLVVTMLLLFLLGLLFLNPIWKSYGIHVPNELNTKVDFTYPLDSIFYIRNAEIGYRWSIKNPTSIWFHPIISWLIQLMPKAIPANWRYYLISIFSAPLALLCIFRYAQNVLKIRINPKLLPLTILIPGGLNMAVGNAESLSLLFNTLIMLSVVEQYPMMTCFIIGITAILIKPNAIYMLIPLLIYGFCDLIVKDYKKALRALIVILGIMVSWSSWILYVDLMSGQFGVYWKAREIATIPLYAGFLTILYRMAEVIFLGNIGEILKYATAFLISFTDLWLVLLVPFRSEKHRIACISSLITILFISFITSNPNKVFIYFMTLPSHILIGWVVMQLGYESIFKKGSFSEKSSISVNIALGIYILISIGMVVFFVVGTPLGWYI
jgi:hypothetical protein